VTPARKCSPSWSKTRCRHPDISTSSAPGDRRSGRSDPQVARLDKKIKVRLLHAGRALDRGGSIMAAPTDSPVIGAHRDVRPFASWKARTHEARGPGFVRGGPVNQDLQHRVHLAPPASNRPSRSTRAAATATARSGHRPPRRSPAGPPWA
jgi:hypothetical protein